VLDPLASPIPITSDITSSSYCKIFGLAEIGPSEIVIDRKLQNAIVEWVHDSRNYGVEGEIVKTIYATLSLAQRTEKKSSSPIPKQAWTIIEFEGELWVNCNGLRLFKLDSLIEAYRDKHYE
jgi:hypothetical protein